MKLKDQVKDILATSLFLSLIVLGVILVNARFEYLEQQKSATESEVHIAQKSNVNQ